MKIKIWFVEDDDAQREILETTLHEKWPEAEITRASSEKDFYDLLASAEATLPPDIVICDVRLKWGDRFREKPLPGQNNYRTAGIRCCDELIKTPFTATVPVILYTVFSDRDLEPELKRLPSHVRLLTKRDDSSELMSEILRLVAGAEAR